MKETAVQKRMKFYRNAKIFSACALVALVGLSATLIYTGQSKTLFMDIVAGALFIGIYLCFDIPLLARIRTGLIELWLDVWSKTHVADAFASVESMVFCLCISKRACLSSLRKLKKEQRVFSTRDEASWRRRTYSR